MKTWCIRCGGQSSEEQVKDVSGLLRVAKELAKHCSLPTCVASLLRTKGLARNGEVNEGERRRGSEGKTRRSVERTEDGSISSGEA